jgi:hypothetical protein
LLAGDLITHERRIPRSGLFSRVFPEWSSIWSGSLLSDWEAFCLQGTSANLKGWFFKSRWFGWIYSSGLKQLITKWLFRIEVFCLQEISRYENAIDLRDLN